MTHEEISLQTKKKFAATLKKIMLSKKLNKITVTDIITECNVNRKTFYYHFENVYDLLKWILEEEAVEVLKQFDFINDKQESILFVINYVENNAHILACAYDSLGREEMRRFLYRDFMDVMTKIVEDIEKELQIELEDNFKLFVCNFYTESLAGIIIEWFKNPKSYEKETLLNYLLVIFESAIPATIKNAPASHTLMC